MEQYRGIALPSITQTDFRVTPEDTVRMANEIAQLGSMEPVVRAIAADLVRGVKDVPKDGAELIARWVRSSILYTQETVGREILQGPITTLRLETGDCDDLVILWCALCRSVGLSANLVGLRKKNAPFFFHAVGYLDGQYYELSLDHTYGATRRGVRMSGLPPETEALLHDPVRGTSRTLRGGDVSPTDVVAGVSDLGIQFSDSVLGGTKLGDAVGLAARAAGTAVGSGVAATTAIASVGSSAMGAAILGPLAAVAGPIGMAVAAVAALGILGAALAKTGKMRGRIADRGNELVMLVNTAVALSGVSSSEQSVLRLRLYEAFPRIIGTAETRGKGTRRVIIATANDIAPSGGAFWSDGSVSRRRGVYNTFHGASKGSSRAAEVMAAHVNAAVALVEALQQIPLPKRREMLAVMIGVALGETGLAGLPSLVVARPVVRRNAVAQQSKTSHTFVIGAAAVAVAALAWSAS